MNDLKPLVGLRKLQVLSLSNNQVEDLSPLFNIRSLQTVVVSGNPFDEEQLTRLKSALPRCEVIYR